VFQGLSVTLECNLHRIVNVRDPKNPQCHTGCSFVGDQPFGAIDRLALAGCKKKASKAKPKAVSRHEPDTLASTAGRSMRRAIFPISKENQLAENISAVFPEWQQAKAAPPFSKNRHRDG
jgi:hypothetical protein